MMTAPGTGRREIYDPYDAATEADPYPVYRRLRDEHPLYYNREHGFFVLSRFADIASATRDYATFSSAQGLTFVKGEMEILGLAPTFIMMDPPRHTQLRRLISKAFTSRRVQELGRDLRRFVRQRLDEVDEAAAAGQRPNLVERLTSPLPTYALCELLGVPEADRGRFDPWSRALAEASLAPERLSGAVVAVAELFQYFIRLLEDRRKRPTGDLLSVLWEAEVDGERMTNWDILGFCFVFVAGGNDTTNHMLANGLVALQQHPDQRALLVREPERLPAAVEEILRYDAPVQGLSRTTTRPVEIHGRAIPEGTKVHLLYGSGNRDPREYGADADAFDVTRSVTRHLSFSHGPHFCVGAHLARLMSSIALEEILARFPRYEIDLAAAARTSSTFVRGYDRLPLAARAA